MNKITDTSGAVLVGLCNDDQFIQTYLGEFHLNFKTGRPVIFQRLYTGIETCELSDVWDHHYTFAKWCNGYGLEIRQQSDLLWRFSTGLNGYSGGSSGILINGGPEMEAIYNYYMSNQK